MLKHHKTVVTLTAITAASTVYFSGVFYAEMSHSEKIKEEIFMLGHKTDSITVQAKNIQENMMYYPPTSRALAQQSLDSLIKEHVKIDSIISAKILQYDEEVAREGKKSWIYILQ